MATSTDILPGHHGTSAPSLDALVPLFGELNDLKRLRVAGVAGSLAESMFTRAWAQLAEGQDVARVALRTAARAVAAARLGGIDADVLHHAGLSEAEALAVVRRSFDEVAQPVAASLRSALRQQLKRHAIERGAVPAFAKRLCEQPRAGATCPGRPRLVLLPAESHGDHCLAVAVYAVLVSPRFNADPKMPFLAAMAHHFHNAYLPDSGFTGEEMLGPHLQPVMHRFQQRALDELPRNLQGTVQSSLDVIAEAHTPEAKAFHAADVIDRVLQMRWYETAARFTLDVALRDLDLVHAGPVQQFHHEILAEAGLW